MADFQPTPEQLTQIQKILESWRAKAEAVSADYVAAHRAMMTDANRKAERDEHYMETIWPACCKEGDVMVCINIIQTFYNF